MVINNRIGDAFDSNHDRNAIPDELKIVGIPCHNQDIVALLLPADGERPDDVISFVAWDFERRDAKGKDKLPAAPLFMERDRELDRGRLLPGQCTR